MGALLARQGAHALLGATPTVSTRKDRKAESRQRRFSRPARRSLRCFTITPTTQRGRRGAVDPETGAGDDPQGRSARSRRPARRLPDVPRLRLAVPLGSSSEGGHPPVSRWRSSGTASTGRCEGATAVEKCSSRSLAGGSARPAPRDRRVAPHESGRGGDRGRSRSPRAVRVCSIPRALRIGGKSDRMRVVDDAGSPSSTA
jgi:hypothetical protein